METFTFLDRQYFIIFCSEVSFKMLSRKELVILVKYFGLLENRKFQIKLQKLNKMQRNLINISASHAA